MINGTDLNKKEKDEAGGVVRFYGSVKTEIKRQNVDEILYNKM